MVEYQLTDRKFSREWRRNKRYSRHELRWLARKKGLEFTERRGIGQMVKDGRVVANFAEVKAQVESVPRPEAPFFAALVLGRAVG